MEIHRTVYTCYNCNRVFKANEHFMMIGVKSLCMDCYKELPAEKRDIIDMTISNRVIARSGR